MKQITPHIEDWKNHFTYHYVRYIILIVVLCLGWSLLFSVSKPETPKSRRMEILFVGLHNGLHYYDEAKAWVENVQLVLEGEGQSASYLSVPEPDAIQEESSSVMLFTYMASESGDLMFLPYMWFEYLASDGAVIPLDLADENGTALVDLLELPSDLDLDYGYVSYKDPDTDEVSTQLCGIPVGNLKGFRDLGIDPSEMIACVPFYCENRENAMRALNWIFANKQEQKDEYWYPVDIPLGEDKEE